MCHPNFTIFFTLKFTISKAILSGDEKTNKHKQLLGIVPRKGGGQICLCVAFFLGKKGNTLTKFLGNLRKVPGQSRDSPGIIPGQSREMFVNVFVVYWFFSGPEICQLKYTLGPWGQSGARHAVIFEIITLVIQKHCKTVTVTVI